MTSDFMGSAAGAMGAPFEALYDPTADPHRDSGAPDRAKYPPRMVRRSLPASGRSPREVTIDDLDWASTPDGRPPPTRTDVTVHPDRDVLGPGFDGTEEDQFERMWRALTLQHSWAHTYIGGTIANPHFSFRDPFVFLLHSNVDRLWASWQLRQRGFHHRRATSWRLDPNRTYGGLADGRIAFPDPDVELRFQEQEARRELNDPFRPWDGSGRVLPWAVQPEPRGAMHPDVVRPPLYDRYAWDDELCCSWPALLLAKRLPANDRIQATIEVDSVASTEIEFVLRAAPGVSWWKGLTISADVEISTENDRRTDSVTVLRSTIDGGELTFSKAIRWWLFLTPHWVMYRLRDLDWLPPGCRVVFDWQAD
jgi:hypothetical protein